MALQQVAAEVYRIPMLYVNAYLIEGDGLTVIDAGGARGAEKILAGVKELGRKAEDIRRILITHMHADHTGGLAALKVAAGAPVFMHPADAGLLSQGIPLRPAEAGPGLMNGWMYRMMGILSGRMKVEPVKTDYEIGDGEEIPGTGGLKVIHTPGHTLGHLAFLWPLHGGVLFAADAASNFVSLDYSILYEDLETGRNSLRKIAGLSFETACFGHGRPIVGGAAAHFRRKWG